jgi:hypothetical protein
VILLASKVGVQMARADLSNWQGRLMSFHDELQKDSKHVDSEQSDRREDNIKESLRENCDDVEQRRVGGRAGNGPTRQVFTLNRSPGREVVYFCGTRTNSGKTCPHIACMVCPRLKSSLASLSNLVLSSRAHQSSSSIEILRIRRTPLPLAIRCGNASDVTYAEKEYLNLNIILLLRYSLYI